ncbi:MAG: tetratricopeptide repeat protein [Acidobacteriota bacterium]|nr:tetratricopeptide repeat protein [Acidobacteriota bacterium]
MTPVLCLYVLTLFQSDSISVHITDLEGKPVVDLVLTTIQGNWKSEPTDDEGRTLLKTGITALKTTMQQGTETTHMMIFPWDGVLLIDSPIQVIPRGDASKLSNYDVQVSLAERVLSGDWPTAFGREPAGPETRRRALAETASALNISSQHISDSLSAWTPSPENPYHLGLKALLENQPDRAVSHLARYLQDQSAQPDNMPPHLYNVAGFLGTAFLAGQKPGEALRAWQFALPLRPKEPSLYNATAAVLIGGGLLKEAEAVIQKAISVAGDKEGRHPGLAAALVNKAQFLLSSGRAAEAEPILLRAAALDVSLLGSGHPTVAEDLDVQALILEEIGAYQKAIPVLQQVLQIDRNYYGPEHPRIADRLTNLALTYTDAGRPDAAEPLLRRALEIDRKALPELHPNISRDLYNLAGVIGDLDRLDEAEVLHRQALALDEKRLGPDHTDVGGNLHNLALLIKATGRLEEAEPLMRRAAEIFKSNPDHPYADMVASNLGFLRLNMAHRYAAEGDQGLARAYFEMTLAEVSRHDPFDDQNKTRRHLAKIHRMLGITCLQSGDAETALTHLETAYAFFSRQTDRDAVEMTCWLSHDLGLAWKLAGNKDEMIRWWCLTIECPFGPAHDPESADKLLGELEEALNSFELKR